MFSVDASVAITSDLNSREGRISVKMSLQRGQIHCHRPESEGARWCSSNKLGSTVGKKDLIQTLAQVFTGCDIHASFFTILSRFSYLFFFSRTVMSDSLQSQRSLTRSSVHRILQARILEWVAVSFSKGSS